jgi:hypothetical protein
MRLLKDLKKTIPLPQQLQQLQQQVIPNTVYLPSSFTEPVQNTRIENLITHPPLPAEVVEPKTLHFIFHLRREFQQINQVNRM